MGIVTATLKSSHDPHKQIACILVSPDGRTVAASNRFPDGIRCDVPGRDRHPDKPDWLQHAERRAVALAARRGVATDGGKVYLNWFPCHLCAPALIDAGIKEVIGTAPDFGHHRYGKSFQISAEMFREAGVICRVYG